MSWSDEMAALSDACIDELGGQVVTYEPQVGASYDLEALRVAPPQFDGEAFLPDTYIAIFAKLADFETAPRKGDTVRLDEAESLPYTVFHVKPDAGGGVILTLTQ